MATYRSLYIHTISVRGTEASTRRLEKWMATLNQYKAQQGGQTIAATEAEAGGAQEKAANRAAAAHQNYTSKVALHARGIAELIIFYQAWNLIVERGIGGAIQQWMSLDSAIRNNMVLLRQTRMEAEDYARLMSTMARQTGIPLEEARETGQIAGRFPGGQQLAQRAMQYQRVYEDLDASKTVRDLYALDLQLTKFGVTASELDDILLTVVQNSTLSAEQLLNLSETWGATMSRFNMDVKETASLYGALSTVIGESGSSLELFVRQLDKLYTDPEITEILRQQNVPSVQYSYSGEEVRTNLYDVIRNILSLPEDVQNQIIKQFPEQLGQRTREFFSLTLQNWQETERLANSVATELSSFAKATEIKQAGFDAGIEAIKTSIKAIAEAAVPATDGAKALLDFAESLNDIANWVERNKSGLLGFLTFAYPDKLIPAATVPRGLSGVRTGLGAAGIDLDPEKFAPMALYGWIAENLFGMEKPRYMRDRLAGGRVARARGRQPVDPWSSFDWTQQEITYGPPTPVYSRLVSQVPAVELPEAFQEIGLTSQDSLQSMLDQYTEKLKASAAAQGIYLDAQEDMIAVTDQYNRILFTLIGDSELAATMFREAGKEAGQFSAALKLMTPSTFFETPRVALSEEMLEAGFGSPESRQTLQEALDHETEKRRQQAESLGQEFDVRKEIINITTSFGAVLFTLTGDARIAADMIKLLAQAAGATATTLGVLDLARVAIPEGGSISQFMSYYNRAAGAAGDLTNLNLPIGGGTPQDMLFTVEGLPVEISKNLVPEIAALAMSMWQADDRRHKESLQAAEQQHNEMIQHNRQWWSTIENIISTPTSVTPTQMLYEVPTGQYEEQWDERVRQMRADINDATSGKPIKYNFGGLIPDDIWQYAMGQDLDTMKLILQDQGKIAEQKWYNLEYPWEMYQENLPALIQRVQDEMAADATRQQNIGLLAAELEKAGLGPQSEAYLESIMEPPILQMMKGGWTTPQVSAEVKKMVTDPLTDKTEVAKTGEAFGNNMLSGMKEVAWVTVIAGYIQSQSDTGTDGYDDLVLAGQAMGTPLGVGMAANVATVLIPYLISEFWKRLGGTDTGGTGGGR